MGNKAATNLSITEGTSSILACAEAMFADGRVANRKRDANNLLRVVSLINS